MNGKSVKTLEDIKMCQKRKPTLFYNCSIITDKDWCKDITCENGGVCVNEPSEFKCECREGWEGEKCATAANQRGLLNFFPTTSFCKCFSVNVSLTADCKKEVVQGIQNKLCSTLFSAVS